MKSVGNELFNFAVIRDIPKSAAELGDETTLSTSSTISIQEVKDSDFGKSILQEPAPEKRLKLAQQFLKSDKLLTRDKGLGVTLSNLLLSLAKRFPENEEKLLKLISKFIKTDASKDANQKEFKDLYIQIIENLIAHLLVVGAHRENLPFLVGSIQLCKLLEETAREDPKLLPDKNSIRKAFSKIVLIPSEFSATSIKVVKPQTDEAPAEYPTTEPTKESFRDAFVAYRMVREVSAHDVKLMVCKEPAGEKGKGKKQEKKSLPNGGYPKISSEKGFFVRVLNWLVKLFKPGQEPSKVAHTLEPNLVLTKRAVDELPESIRERLSKMEIDPTTAPVSIVKGAIKKIAQQEYSWVFAKSQRFGGTHIAGTYLFSPNWVEFIIPNGETEEPVTDEEEPIQQSPIDYPSVRLLGIDELLVVRQKSVKYQAGEIAHIENVLEGESHFRKHRRLNRAEEFIARVLETTTENVLDLQTSEKFEIEREVSEQLSEQQHLEAGLKVSASYGPTVSAESNFGYQSDSSLERSTRTASNYSREVTERAVERIKERIQRTRETRTIVEVEEINSHEISNPPGHGHKSGVYQYVDKIYELQTYNYGKRLMLEFIVPEPGAYLRHLRKTVMDFDPPDPFNITLDDIDELSYTELAARWQVSDIEPPPDDFLVVPYSIKLKVEEPPDAINHAGRVRIPDGYELSYAIAAVHSDSRAEMWTEPSLTHSDWAKYVRISLSGFYFMNVAWSGRQYWPPDFEGFPVAEDLRRGELPITIGAVGITGLPLNVGIALLCKPTTERIMEWKCATFGALQAGYQRLLSDYEEKLSAASVAQGVSIRGDNPANNRVREKRELKRNCIELMTRSYLGTPDLLSTSSIGQPLVDFGALDSRAPSVRFFESVFEWDNIIYELYPYYWTGASKWDKMHSEEDPDPLHKKFLQSGLARVTVPIRPGEEARALYYIDFLGFWEDQEVQPPHREEREPLIAIMSEFVQDIKEQPDGVPFGDKWYSRLPTSLVTLREQNGLPGDWIDLVSDVSTT